MIAPAMADPASEHQALRQELLRDIVGKGNAEARLAKQGDDLESRKQLLQFAFLNVFTPEVVTQVASDAQGETFIQTLHANPVWLRMLMTSGPINQPELTLNCLASI